MSNLELGDDDVNVLLLSWALILFSPKWKQGVLGENINLQKSLSGAFLHEQLTFSYTRVIQ